jgi:hypothetical protein
MARLAWGVSALVSEPAFEVNHHTAEASTRRRPGVLVGRCLMRRRQIDPELTISKSPPLDAAIDLFLNGYATERSVA